MRRAEKKQSADQTDEPQGRVTSATGERCGPQVPRPSSSSLFLSSLSFSRALLFPCVFFLSECRGRGPDARYLCGERGRGPPRRGGRRGRWGFVREGSRRGRGPGWLTRFAPPRGRIPSRRFHHFHESLPPSLFHCSRATRVYLIVIHGLESTSTPHRTYRSRSLY